MNKHSVISSILLFGFFLGIYRGKIAIWKIGIEEPMRVFPYSASMLPESDQKKLQKGIFLDHLEELYPFLEDYLS